MPKRDYDKEPYLHPSNRTYRNVEILNQAIKAKQRPNYEYSLECELVPSKTVEGKFQLLCKNDFTFWTTEFIFQFLEGVDLGADLARAYDDPGSDTPWYEEFLDGSSQEGGHQ